MISAEFGRVREVRESGNEMEIQVSILQSNTLQQRIIDAKAAI